MILILIKFCVKKRSGEINSHSGTEEDHKIEKRFKKIMVQKMRLHVEDDSDPALISKIFWKYAKFKSKLTRIPETVWYGELF